jgi:hypothetical protein
MIWTYNQQFENLLNSFAIRLDKNLQTTIFEQISWQLYSDFHVKEDEMIVGKIGILYKEDETYDKDLSSIEDFNNHFHVGDYFQGIDECTAFTFSIELMKVLASLFERQGVQGVRIWASFETAAMAQAFAIRNNLAEEGEEFSFNDRISFFKIRKGQMVIDQTQARKSHSAIAIVDV